MMSLITQASRQQFVQQNFFSLHAYARWFATYYAAGGRQRSKINETNKASK